jgi:hypothetical protein
MNQPPGYESYGGPTPSYPQRPPQQKGLSTFASVLLALIVFFVVLPLGSCVACAVCAASAKKVVDESKANGDGGITTEPMPTSTQDTIGPIGRLRSYENVLASDKGATKQKQSLTNAQLAAPLRHATFITACGAPDEMKVQVRAAIRMGATIGVTVETTPPKGDVAMCIDHAVRKLGWPTSPTTDYVTTNY